MEERLQKLLEVVIENEKMEVNKLSEILGVSKVTIRKDLDKLEKKGLIHREHGYAAINSQDDINYRLSSKYDIKRKIAVKASEIVSDGETIMIESGSTCVLLAEELCRSRKDITIITNSYFIANYLRNYSNSKVVLLGGEYQKESQVTVGPLIRIASKSFYVDKLFVGIDGFDPSYGFTGSDLMRCEAAKLMAESSKNLIILTDSSKFSQRGLVSQFKFNEVKYIYTDNGISEESKVLLEKNLIKVVIA